MREKTAPGPTPFGRPSRALFSFAPEYTPLNHGSYGTVPEAITAERAKFLHASEASPDGFKLREYPAILTASRTAVAPLLGAHVDEVVLVPNATSGINTVFRNLPLSPGDVVLHFSTVYGACLKTLQNLSETSAGIVPREVEVRYPIEDEDLVGRLRAAALEEKHAGRRVRAAIFDVISSGPGVLVPWEALVRACRELGILSVLDAAHGIGQVDLTHLGSVSPDFCVSNCHKWLFAPRGCSVLYVPFRNQHFIKTSIPTSHGYVAPPDRAGIAPGPNGGSYFTNLFVDVATLDNTTYCVVPHAIRLRQRVWGGEAAIRAYCHGLARDGGRRAAAILGTEVLDNAAGSLTRCGLVNVRLPIVFGPGGIPLAEGPAVHQWLINCMFDEFYTYIPPNWYHGVMLVRFSAQVYLSIEDFEWGARVLLELCERLKKEWRSAD